MSDLHGLKQALEPLAADLRVIFGARLRSLIVYGTHGSSLEGHDPAAGTAALPFDPGPTLHTLALVDRLAFDDLAACARKHGEWKGRHYAVPLIMGAGEFERSLDAFPLEFAEILHHHVLVAGEDPFVRLTVQAQDLRRACEVQAKSHLVHLREAYVESSGDAAAVAALIAASARPFESLLRNIAHLQDAHVRSREDLARHAEQAMGIQAPVIHRVVGLLHPADLPPAEAIRIFPPYLEVVERLATYVDEWTR
jgi:hypothetical protein